MESPPYRCMLCGKYFESPQAIDDHYDSWDHYEKFDDLLQERKYRCDICFNRCETNADFEMHVSVYHPQFPAHAILTKINTGVEDSEKEVNEGQNQQQGITTMAGEHDDDDDGGGESDDE
ncbi:hypothetical protein Q3G72_027515 [Acer saccharum]|nr:hypothetical protein Q3G72_027515 [Acer saccharum]